MLDLKKLQLLEADEQSGVFKVNKCIHVALNPRYLSKLHKGIIHYFSKQVGKFHPTLEGILLGHGKIFLKSRRGVLLNEDACIHLDIISDFWIFRPEVGKEIRGMVNKKSINHVSLLVHETFNISCPRNLMEEPWLGENVKIGQTISITVKQANFSQNIPDIVGNLLPMETVYVPEPYYMEEKRTDNEAQSSGTKRKKQADDARKMKKNKTSFD